MAPLAPLYLISASLSLIACLLVIINYAISARFYPLFTVKIQFFISIVETAFSLTFFLDLIPDSYAVSAFIKQFAVMAAHGWSLAYVIVQYSFVVLRYRRAGKYEPVYHSIIWGFSALSMLVSIVEYVFRAKPSEEVPIDTQIDKLLTRVILCYAVIILIDIACSVLLVQVLIVFKRERKIHSDPILVRRFRWISIELLVLLIGYILVHVLWVIDCFLGFFSTNWVDFDINPFHIIERLLTPLAGVVNAIVYFIEVNERIRRGKRKSKQLAKNSKAVVSYDRFRHPIAQQQPIGDSHTLHEELPENLDENTYKIEMEKKWNQMDATGVFEIEETPSGFLQTEKMKETSPLSSRHVPSCPFPSRKTAKSLTLSLSDIEPKNCSPGTVLVTVQDPFQTDRTVTVLLSSDAESSCFVRSKRNKHQKHKTTPKDVVARFSPQSESIDFGPTPTQTPSSLLSFAPHTRSLPPTLSVFLLTFNLATYCPNDIPTLLTSPTNSRGEPASKCDLLFLGFQEAIFNVKKEVEDGNEALINIPPSLSEFLSAVLHSTHALVETSIINGIQSFLFAKYELFPFIQIHRKATEAVGKMQILGNKGGAAIIAGIGEESRKTKKRREISENQASLHRPNSTTFKRKRGSTVYESFSSESRPLTHTTLHTGSTILALSNCHLHAYAWRGWERMQNVRSLIAGMSGALCGDRFTSTVQQTMKDYQKVNTTNTAHGVPTQRVSKKQTDSKINIRQNYSVVLTQFSDKLDHSFVDLSPTQHKNLARVFTTTLEEYEAAQSAVNSVDFTLPFDVSVFLGDLNYRLDIPFDLAMNSFRPLNCISVKMSEEKSWRDPTHTTAEMENLDSAALILHQAGRQYSSGDGQQFSLEGFDGEEDDEGEEKAAEKSKLLDTNRSLLRFDQLHIQRSKHKLFFGFFEPAVLPILPSYRLVHHRPPETRQSRVYAISNKKNQTPSFTDRILTKPAIGMSTSLSELMKVGRKGMMNHAFDCLTSDHAPVSEILTVVVNPPPATLGDVLSERAEATGGSAGLLDITAQLDETLVSFDVRVDRVECVGLTPVTISDTIDPFITISSTSLDLQTLADSVQLGSSISSFTTTLTSTVRRNSTHPIWEQEKHDFLPPKISTNERQHALLSVPPFRFCVNESQLQYLFDSLLLSQIEEHPSLTTLSQTPTHALVTLSRMDCLALISAAVADSVSGERLDLTVVDAGLVGEDCVVGACSVRMSLEGTGGIQIDETEKKKEKKEHKKKKMWDAIDLSQFGEMAEGEATLLVELPHYPSYISSLVAKSRKDTAQPNTGEETSDETHDNFFITSATLVRQEDQLKEEEAKTEGGRQNTWWGRDAQGRNETIPSLHQMVMQLYTQPIIACSAASSLLHSLVESLFQAKYIHIVLPLTKETLLKGFCSLGLTVSLTER